MKAPVAVCLGLAVLALPGGSVYYASGDGDSCARCHEIRSNADTWHVSTHRTVPCKGCHGDSMFNFEFHAGNLRRLVTHLRGETPEKIRLREKDVEQMAPRCQGCHRQEFADWKAGAHSTSYGKVFLDAAHNRKRLLMDDCLRCHGMFFEGAAGDLVTPLNTRGPWSLKDAGKGNQAAIPCLACHAMHREGALTAKATAATQKVLRPSLALWDRREGDHVPVTAMALPVILEGERAVRMSPDPRQTLCYQCHAALATRQVWSGDDRTPVGVHEGLSCLACHQKHTQETRASCATCHPKLSNCGLDVEKMDTTFRDPKSRFNIHTAKCLDCHPKGVPAKRQVARQ